jgi:hypothetical protein
MTYEQLMGFFGGPSKAAKALGIPSRQTVDSWRERRIPAKWQMKAENLSGGKLRADRQARKEAEEMASYLKSNSHDKRVEA